MSAPPTIATLPAWLEQRLAAVSAAHGTGGLRVGFSGGLDSHVLLHALAHAPTARALGLSTLHVHHGLHADADAWLAHCAATCAALAVPFTAVRVRVAPAGDGPEGAARAARMQAFAEHLPTGHVLALAQHQDDQAETFLLRALRGAGPAGLAAMPAWRRHAAGWLWRPLLELPRALLRDYAVQHGLCWIEDPANSNPAFARSALRLEVMPRLHALWPDAAAGLARAARLAAEAELLLAAHDPAALAAVRHRAQPDGLDVPALLALPREQRARVLRAWVMAQGLPPLPHAHLARIEHEVLPAATDTCARVQWADAVVQRWRDGLHAYRALPAWPADWQMPWDGRAPLRLPDGGRLHLIGGDAAPAALPMHCHVRARRGGERIRQPGRTHHHRLKALLHASDVPPWQRERLPLLCTDAEAQLLAAADRWCDADFAAWLHHHHLRLHWQPAAGDRAFVPA